MSPVRHTWIANPVDLAKVVRKLAVEIFIKYTGGLLVRAERVEADVIVTFSVIGGVPLARCLPVGSIAYIDTVTSTF